MNDYLILKLIFGIILFGGFAYWLWTGLSPLREWYKKQQRLKEQK